GCRGETPHNWGAGVKLCTDAKEKMERIKKFYNNHKQLILYLVFGAITTVVSLAVCFLTLRIGVKFMHDEAGEPTEMLDVLGSTTQWVSGVLVAFITNRLWVFTDAEKGVKAGFKQLAVFSGSRVATYFVEVFINLGVIALFDGLGYTAPTLNLIFFSLALTSRIWAKLISSIVVVISNYFISKLLVFKKKC
ncbi:MAG: GtrA family protein, partial [Clostridia bacterium]|nr:GtrA family protein [Clostridia bacterium]